MAWKSGELDKQSPNDGEAWPVKVAAEVLCIPEQELRALVRLAGLRPVGTLQLRQWGQGRAAASYDAAQLVACHEALLQLRQIAGNDV